MFPSFNIYSTTLLVLVIQGVMLALLLINSYVKQGRKSGLILGILLLITCYHRTTYTIGFMSWYDTYRTTKINYFLISLSLAVGPLIYFYIKSFVQTNFKFQRRDIWHFLPTALYIIFKIGVYLFDSNQLGFDDTQNGVFIQSEASDYVYLFYSIIQSAQLLLYLAFSFYTYYQYRDALVHHYSNTYKLELKWLRNFLIVYSLLFIYEVAQMVTDGFIFDLHWTQEWWYQLFSILVVVYVGIKGYFTNLDSLTEVDLSTKTPTKTKPNKGAFKHNKELKQLQELVSSDQLYLNPNLSLTQLSRKSKMNSTQVSDLINRGLGQNFNDFINRYRVEEVINRFQDDKYDHLSILAIALDCGFNSKATFNRVFKKTKGESPSTFRK